MGIKLDINGGDEAIEKYLSRYRSVAERQPVKNAMTTAGEMIAEVARRKAPEESGELSEGIVVITSAGAKTVTVRVSSGKARYASPLEHGHAPSGWNKGTKDVLPKPFMWPAFEEKKQAAKALIVDAVKKAVKKEA